MIIRDLFKEEIKGKSVTIKTVREKIAENVQLRDGEKYRPKQQRQVVFETYFQLWSLIG